MKAKKGKSIEPVIPCEPEEVFDADDADPGKVAEIKAEQLSKGSGKFGKTKLPAHKSKGNSAGGSNGSGQGSGQGEGSHNASKDVASSNKGQQSGNEEDNDDSNNSWVGIVLTDEDDNPIVGEKYEVILPNGKVSKGTTGQDGKAKIEGFEPGECEIRFPNLDDDALTEN